MLFFSIQYFCFILEDSQYTHIGTSRCTFYICTFVSVIFSIYLFPFYFFQGWSPGSVFQFINPFPIFFFSSTNYLIFIFLRFLFIYSWETHRERQRHRQREKQAPCREPDVGLHLGSPGSLSGLKVALNRWATWAALHPKGFELLCFHFHLLPCIFKFLL